MEHPDAERSSFFQSCSYCGAQFEVEIERREGSNHTQPYACPECRKSYSARATSPPHVRLLTGRTDGKGDSYQETMF
jgi:hypothetical protein